MIKPKDYADALEVQDASNITAVARTFAEVLGRIGKFFEETNDPQLPLAELNRHPIAVMYASKVASLTGVQGDESSDLRDQDGVELLLTVQVLTFALVQLRTVATMRTLAQPLDQHVLCQALAKRCEQLTAAGSMQVFSLAYEACQHGRDYEGETVPASETWLHQVMSPSADDIAKAKGLDWRCADCGATGQTIELQYDTSHRSFGCPHCASPGIVPLTAVLTAELKDPAALWVAMQIRRASQS